MKYDLEQRLIRFAVSIVKIMKELPQDRASNHLAGQLVRSGTAPALLYGEAQSAESRKDFIHKMKVALKELRETNICLNIIRESGFLNESQQVERILNENNELVSIFHKSISTAIKNLKDQNE
jgi:four helix bundle protein